MNTDKNRFFYSFIPPLILVLLMAVVKVVEVLLGLNLGFLGVFPLHMEGLPGILLAPMIHENFNHLYSNVIPLFFLGGLLFYFYRPIAWEVTAGIWIVTGILVWLGARESYHIGASGVVYGLASFHLLGGIVRRDPKMMAISCLVIFLYGGMLWGIFPDFFPGKNISWESHMAGMITGVILAVYYRKQGPQPPVYEWEEDYQENQYDWPEEIKPDPATDEHEADQAKKMMIKYIYRRRDEESNNKLN